ncbi:hypothetical protein SCLCIDRAFT_24205 [Scleroderma citrinum Foug A]|uniref:Uncharacterized protein n=1 Tax=Scleroderma citrinum Foug A TaxID=1036808 RepID=A0A0C3E514_9AGAM|nr:hypothetical protein SCLCIDRAFT_24205 [Scleroderma citrinum Foug A]
MSTRFPQPSGLSGSILALQLGINISVSTLGASVDIFDASVWLLVPSVSYTGCFASPMLRSV